MAQISWSASALSDIHGIFDYISKDSKPYAIKMIDKIYLRASSLTSQPYIGRIVPEYNMQTIREVFVGAYRIIYEIIDEKNISILRIFHGARLLGV